MPVVTPLAQPTSPAAMDRVVRRRGPSLRVRLGAVAAGVAALGVGLWQVMPAANGQTVAADRVTISTVRQGVFEDFLPLRARATPLVTVYLDAVEGGRVEEVLVEDGATVKKGQLLARLSNADLQLSTLARQTEVEQQLNNLRQAELSLAQTRIADRRNLLEAELGMSKAQRMHDRQAPLAARGFVPTRQFDDTVDELAYQRRRHAVLFAAQATDERLQSSQLAQLRASAASMRSSLGIARANLNQLDLRAPAAGQLTAFSIQVGQSLSRGERLGQIDSAGRTKLVAGVDEYYLGRVEPGQTAALDWQGRRYRLTVAKITPQVKNGEFEIDLHFIGAEPGGLQRGQTLPARLTLSDPAPARLVPAGSWFNDSGGAWVFVVSADGRSAQKRAVRFGRRNADAVEVLDGLEPGERVLTSPYTGLVDKDRLDLQR